MDDIDKLRKEIINSDTFCFHPFLEISTRPNGTVEPCCYYSEEDYIVLSEKLSDENNIDKFWNGDRFVNIRKKIAAGESLDGCKVCYRDGAASMRMRSIKQNINNTEYLKLVKDTIDNNGVAIHLPKRLELKPNNLCNLKCIICNAYDSSQIEKELRELDAKHGGVKSKGGRFFKIVDTPGVWEGPVKQYELPNMLNLDWANTGTMWKDLERILPDLHVLSFAGGEPTVNPIVYKILDYCVQNDYAKNISVFISSNFTNLNKKFFDTMPHFKKFELIASIDGLDQVQEYIRYPSNWETIKKNFAIARNYMQYPNVKIFANITVNILNIFYITDLLKFLEDHAFKFPYYEEWPYNINLLYYPEELRIDWIPEAFRSEVIERILDYQHSSTMLKQFPDLKVKTDLLINVLNQSVDNFKVKEQLEILENFLMILDEHRNVSYKKSLPWLNDVILHAKKI